MTPRSGLSTQQVFRPLFRTLMPVVLLVAVGCGGSQGGGSFPGAPIVLISVDTLRSDHLPSYGYRGVETPAISAFERDAILFERAYSHYPLTLPSHSSILTGLLPTEHGVRDNIGYPLDAKNLSYLPRELQAARYTTAGAVSSYVLEGGHGLAVGFDLYDDEIEVRPGQSLGGLQRPGDETFTRILPWLEKAGENPFFLFLHLYEPHTPYEPPEPFRSRFPLAYDGEIAQADAILGRLFATLKRLSIYDRALIVLVSDHGEGLGEHGEEEHGILLYRESLQVPLLLKLPGQLRGGERVSAPAALIDIAPTLLSLAELPVPERMSGARLTTLGESATTRPLYAETYYPRLHMGWNDLASLIEDGFHYIEGPDPELYRLESDPGEKANVLLAEKRRFGTLRQRLASHRTPLKKPGEIDPESVARLAALGYAGGNTQLIEGPLPDPKTKISSLSELKEVSRHMGDKRYPEALAILERLVRENPRMQDAWESLARCLLRLGRRQEAVAVYQKALENSGGAAHLALALASLYSEMGRADDARRHAELAMSASPGPAHRRLAEIAMTAEQFEEAERQARAAVAVDENDTQALVVLSMVLNRLGKLEESERTVQLLEAKVAEAKAVPPAGYRLVRGDLMARSGRAAEAEKVFREEIRANPEMLETYRRLALLLVSAGRGAEAWQVLQQMVEGNESSPASFVSAVETLRVLGDATTADRLLRHALSRYPRDERLAAL